MRAIRATFVAAVALATLTGAAQAQRQWGGQFNGGYPVGMGKTGDAVSGSFTWGGGVRYTPNEDAVWGLRLDVRTSRFNGKVENIQPILEHFGAEDAYARTWDFTLQAEVGMKQSSKVRAYAIGGIGYYNRYAALTKPTVVGGCYWDPWWGYICGSGVGDEIVVDKNSWDFGANGGAGVAFSIGRGASLFVEAVYNVMFTKGQATSTGGTTTKASNTEWMPIYVGVRF